MAHEKEDKDRTLNDDGEQMQNWYIDEVLLLATYFFTVFLGIGWAKDIYKFYQDLKVPMYILTAAVSFNEQYLSFCIAKGFSWY